MAVPRFVAETLTTRYGSAPVLSWRGYAAALRRGEPCRERLDDQEFRGVRVRFVVGQVKQAPDRRDVGEVGAL